MRPEIRAIRLGLTWALLLILVVASTACEPRTADQRSDGAGADDGGVAPDPASLFLTIDNMEIRTDLPAFPPGSAGFWWPLGDGGLGNWFFDSAGDGVSPGPSGDALADNILPPRGDSMRARHLRGSGSSGGIDLYAQLKHPTNHPVDLSPYLGISFWAKLSGPSRQLIVAFRDGSSANILTAQATDSHFSQALSVSEQWERFILLFDDFHQGVISGTGSAVPFSADSVSDIDFVVGLSGEPFDLWIDDLALLCRGVCRLRSF